MQALAAALALAPELARDVSLPLGIGIAALSSLVALLLRELLGLPAVPIQAPSALSSLAISAIAGAQVSKVSWPQQLLRAALDSWQLLNVSVSTLLPLRVTHPVPVPAAANTDEQRRMIAAACTASEAQEEAAKQAEEWVWVTQGGTIDPIDRRDSDTLMRNNGCSTIPTQQSRKTGKGLAPSRSFKSFALEESALEDEQWQDGCISARSSMDTSAERSFSRRGGNSRRSMDGQRCFESVRRVPRQPGSGRLPGGHGGVALCSSFPVTSLPHGDHWQQGYISTRPSLEVQPFKKRRSVDRQHGQQQPQEAQPGCSAAQPTPRASLDAKADPPNPEQAGNVPLAQGSLIHDALARWSRARGSEAAGPAAAVGPPAVAAASCPAAVREAVPDAFLPQMTALLGDTPQGIAAKPWGAPKTLLGMPDQPTGDVLEWDHILQKSAEGMEYNAWRTPWRRGLYMYKTSTVVKDVSPAELRRFQLDDQARMEWDTSAVTILHLGNKGSSNADNNVAYYRVRYPRPMADREYVYARRVWERQSDGGAYIINTAAEHPEAPQGHKAVSVTDYVSCTAVRAAPAPSVGRDATELVTLYFEDPCARTGIVNTAVRKGLWGYAQRHEAALRAYCSKTILPSPDVPATAVPSSSNGARALGTRSRPAKHGSGTRRHGEVRAGKMRAGEMRRGPRRPRPDKGFVLRRLRQLSNAIVAASLVVLVL